MYSQDSLIKQWSELTPFLNKVSPIAPYVNGPISLLMWLTAYWFLQESSKGFRVQFSLESSGSNIYAQLQLSEGEIDLWRMKSKGQHGITEKNQLGTLIHVLLPGTPCMPGTVPMPWATVTENRQTRSSFIKTYSLVLLILKPQLFLVHSLWEHFLYTYLFWLKLVHHRAIFLKMLIRRSVFCFH